MVGTYLHIKVEILNDIRTKASTSHFSELQPQRVFRIWIIWMGALEPISTSCFKSHKFVFMLEFFAFAAGICQSD